MSAAFDVSTMTRKEKEELLHTLEALDTTERRNLIRSFFKTAAVRAEYKKQMQFFEYGKAYNERALFGGNRSGKTVAGGFEMTCHLTGNYPDWWPGRRFDHPVDAWTAGDTAKNVRDIMQSLMLGKPGDADAVGTGMIPAEFILRTTTKHGVADAVETVYVRHVPTGGVSSLQFKSYDQGRVAFQGTSQHVIHLDEEPPEEVYTESLLRTMTVNGILYLTATPLQGLTKLMLLYLPELAPTPDGEPVPTAEGLGKIAVMVSWEDVPHLSAAQKAAILAGIPPWQRDARTKGVPQLGAGAIYQIPESDIVIPGFEIPPHWPRGYGMDVGWNRTAVAFFAINPETGGVVQYDEYYRGQAEPSVHAAAIHGRGKWLPGVIDPASRGRGQKDGEQLLEIYQQLGLNVDVADNAREAGIYMVWEAFSQGQLKIFNSCANTRNEYRLYRRNEKGEVVKSNDHLMDALRYFMMSGRSRAKVQPTELPEGKRWFDWHPPHVWAG